MDAESAGDPVRSRIARPQRGVAGLIQIPSRDGNGAFRRWDEPRTRRIHLIVGGGQVAGRPGRGSDVVERAALGYLGQPFGVVRAFTWTLARGLGSSKLPMTVLSGQNVTRGHFAHDAISATGQRVKLHLGCFTANPLSVRAGVRQRSKYRDSRRNPRSLKLSREVVIPSMRAATSLKRGCIDGRTDPGQARRAHF